MIELLAKKSGNGDLFINQAKRHLANHDWGLARKCVEDGIAQEQLSNRGQAMQLLEDIKRRLGYR